MRLRTLSLLCALLLLGGCLGNQGADGMPTFDEPIEDQPVIVYEAEPGLSAKQRKRKAIELLQVGNAGQAKAELQAYLLEVPGSELARNLLQQIDADPVAYLGAENFTYKMRSGDSLSGIAKRILGDPMKFHILARYNGIDNPSKIEAGQIIKVPGKKASEAQLAAVEEIKPEELPEANDDELESEPAAVVPAAEAEVEEVSEAAFVEEGQVDSATAPVAGFDTGAEEPEATPDLAGDAEPAVELPLSTEADQPQIESQVAAVPPPEVAPLPAQPASPGEVLNEAEAMAQGGDFEGAIKLYEEGMNLYPDDPLLRKFAAANYETYAGQLETKGRLDEAEDLLYRAQALDPESGTIKERLIAYARQDEADEWFHAGTSHLAADKRIQAFEAFQKAVAIVPDHKLANQKLIDLAPAVTEDYHRQALTAFRRQELEPAIELWDKALVIDPNYAPALLYREQAIDLKTKLEGIKE